MNMQPAYRRTVGKLQWMTYTRPDISYATKELATALQAPTTADQQKLKHLLRYLKEKRNTTGRSLDQQQRYERLRGSPTLATWLMEQTADEFLQQHFGEVNNYQVPAGLDDNMDPANTEE